MIVTIFKVDLKKDFFKGKIYFENMLKIAFIPMSFLHFFAVFYKKYFIKNTVIYYRYFSNVKNTAKVQRETGHSEKL